MDESSNRRHQDVRAYLSMGSSSGSLTSRTSSLPSSAPARRALSVLVFPVPPGLHLWIPELTSSWANRPDVQICWAAEQVCMANQGSISLPQFPCSAGTCLFAPLSLIWLLACYFLMQWLVEMCLHFLFPGEFEKRWLCIDPTTW